MTLRLTVNYQPEMAPPLYGVLRFVTKQLKIRVFRDYYRPYFENPLGQIEFRRCGKSTCATLMNSLGTSLLQGQERNVIQR